MGDNKKLMGEAPKPVRDKVVMATKFLNFETNLIYRNFGEKTETNGLSILRNHFDLTCRNRDNATVFRLNDKLPFIL